MTEAEVNALLSKCIIEYNAQVQSPNYQNWDTTFATLQLLREELKQEKIKRADVIKNSHKKAGMQLALAFTGATAQWVGMGSCIYIFADWNTVEPWTWTFCKYLFFN